VTAFRVIRPGVEIPAHMAVLSDLSPSAVRSQTAKI
jgi:tRNA G26 N,N-dimethylase Trm1